MVRVLLLVLLCGYARAGHDTSIEHDIELYLARMESIDDSGSFTAGEVFLNDRPIGRVDLMFSHLNSSNAAGLPAGNFVFTDQFMRLFENFRNAGGPERSVP